MAISPMPVSAVAAGTMMRHLASVGSVGAAHFNIYMPHWKVEG